ncbi:multiheme c-type cytochrome [Marinobacter sp.]|uniref:multiheme c-type cytochrome n=1 Tax=Marinobacter sp. TaxID=50741 RepID=UPI002B26B1F9|nr:multiheme c-type cytochrome [Marinobacter sp.]
MSQGLLGFRFLVGLWALLVGADALAESFAGSESCKSCHETVYEQYERSGHPYKIQAVEGARPLYPSGTSPGVPHPPLGEDWKSISYVIGGFGWKARFMDAQGYILTGESRQYNLPNMALGLDAHWVAYGGDEPSRKPYTCGGCHTTGWESTGAAGPHQAGLPGIHGTWAEPGVTCEACHGASADHVTSPKEFKPTVEENCGTCHSRGDPSQIDAKGGLIRHHEQYEDLLASPHKPLGCGACHDPHKSTIYQAGGYLGADTTCKTCHQNIEIKLEAKKDVACQTCHMPHAVKSAVSTVVTYDGGSVPKGDLRTHIQRISTDPNWKMFTDDGAFVRVDDAGKAYLTLDYVCLSCHVDKDKEWAQSYAEKVH